MERFIRKTREKIQKFLLFVEWEKMTIQHRMFHVIAIIGTIVSFVCLIETIFVSQSTVLIATLTVLFVVTMASLWISIFRKKIHVAAIVFGFFINFIVFPALFLLGGGLNGGATIWFLIGYFYTFMMFRKRTLWAFLIPTIVEDVIFYALAMHTPEMVEVPSSLHNAYLDSLFSVIAVGVAMGILLRTIIMLYDKEQTIANEQRDELEKSSKSRNNLFAGMSHEIRTPINTIMGLNELILRSNPSAEIEEYATDIDNASTMLLSLVNDILDFSRIEIQQLDIIPLEYNSKAMFMNLYDMIQIHAKKKNLQLKFDVDTQLPAFLYGDEKRIKQVALNLLNNAVKYTDKGTITLEATGEKTPDGMYQMRLTISDTGMGIKKEDIAHLYESFSRFDEKKNSSIEGSGLGLAIVKQLVDLMGGTINVDSIYTRGTVFTVVIPQKIVEHTPVGNIRFGESEDKHRYRYQQKFEAPDVRILIVDDNRVNSVVTSRLLASTRMQVYSAANGKECLEICRRKYFHLILMDYMMPDMDGSETLAQLRSQENGLCKETPVIALTATSRAEAESLHIGSEFDGYLEKPIRSDLLEEEILNLLPRELVTYRQETSKYESGEDNPAASIRKKKKVRITTDSACDLPKELLEKYDIHVQNLYIRTSTGRFQDSVEIDTDNMSQYISLEEVHADSCSIDEFEAFFADNLVDAVDLVHVSVASNSGVTYGQAVEAAEGFDHVHVFDSGHVSCGQAILVLEAARLASLGKTADEITVALERYRVLVNSRFIIPEPSRFQENGYTSKFTANFCKLFRLHPMLGMKNRRISVRNVLGGDGEQLWKKFVSIRLRRTRRIDNRIVVLSFASCSTHLKSVVLEEISNRVAFENVIVCKSSFSNAVNCGEDTFGFAYYEID